jgi:hypothetical protein
MLMQKQKQKRTRLLKIYRDVSSHEFGLTASGGTKTRERWCRRLQRPGFEEIGFTFTGTESPSRQSKVTDFDSCGIEWKMPKKLTAVRDARP